MTETVAQELADLIDAFNAAWTRPAAWNAGQTDERTIRVREIRGSDRDEWVVELLALIRAVVTAPEASLPQWSNAIAGFRQRMVAAAEKSEMEILRAIEGFGLPDGE